jgi:two-component system NtrC family sensor kinase
MDASVLERRLEAAQKTIAALMLRVEERMARGDAAFAIMEQNVALERVVGEKTRQLEAQREALQRALTELRLAQADLLHAQKLESVGRLASGIAHEINTPIQFVSDNVLFVRRSLPGLLALVERYRELRVAAAAGTIERESLAALEAAELELDLGYLKENLPLALDQSAEGLLRVATLVRSMKEFAHPDQKEKVLADLNRALSTTLTVARNEYKYVADVETELGELPLVPCLVGELNQVFLNLVVNAAHAIEAALRGTQGRGTIRVSTRREGDAVVIAVSDTGTGIPEEIRGRVFEPFFTTKEVGKGTGQGLAIARSVVVDKHGGKLTFETAPGRGTTFFVRLPLG